MAIIRHPRLYKFVEGLTGLFSDGGYPPAHVLERTVPLMKELIAADDGLPDAMAVPHEKYYQQYLLYADPQDRFSVVSFVWGPGQQTPVHEMPQHLGPLELHVDDLACAHVHGVKLEHIFGDVQPNDLQAAHLAGDLPRALCSTTMHDGTSLVVVKTLIYHDAMGTLMPYPVEGPACLADKPHAHNGRAVHLSTPGGVCAARRQGRIHYISR